MSTPGRWVTNQGGGPAWRSLGNINKLYPLQVGLVSTEDESTPAPPAVDNINYYYDYYYY